MFRFSILCLSALVFLSFNPALVLAEEELPAAVNQRMDLIHGWAASPLIKSFVKAQNSRGQTLEEIMSADQTWRETDKKHPLKKELMSNDCAKLLRSFAKSEHALLETFVMDNQGALVCTLRLTSDYWQGDEAKWQKSFAGGTGADYIAPPEFDESTRATLIQVSVPIMEEDKAIGVLMVGLNSRMLRQEDNDTRE